MCGPGRFGGVVDHGGELIFMGLSLRAARGIIIITRLCWPLNHRVDSGGKEERGKQGGKGVYIEGWKWGREWFDSCTYVCEFGFLVLRINNESLYIH
jgi:hypothetical protein